MSRNIDPNFLRMQQEYMRNKGLERAKNTVPDYKRDKKILIGAAVTFGILAVLLILFWGFGSYPPS